MGTPDALSPLSLNSADRYYPSHLSSPLSAGPRSSNPFERQNSYQTVSHSRQHVRPLQPLQLRDTLSRSRSDSIQSPLRSSMSWKGETLDYGNYQTGQPSPQLTGRQQSVYQPDQMGTSNVNAHQYDANAYSSSSQVSFSLKLFHNPCEDHPCVLTLLVPDTNMQNSATHMTYSSSHGPGTSSTLQQQSPSAMSRLRATSATFPAGLDLRTQCRPMPSQGNSPRGLPATPRSSSFANAFTGGYASAPLTAPVDFQLPRTPIDPSNRDFNIPQLSAPMAPPQDFSNAYNSNLSPVRGQQGDRDFGNQGQNNEDPGGQGPGQVGDEQQTRNNDESYLSPDQYETDQKRRGSFIMPGAFESP
jgi:hypothetical protein